MIIAFSVLLNILSFVSAISESIARNAYDNAYKQFSTQLIQQIEKDKRLVISTESKTYNLILQEESR